MAGARKHALRSRKTVSKNYSNYRSFVFKVSAKNEVKKQRKTFAERIASLFSRKHQDR